MYNVRRKKKARRKGSIESSKFETFSFRRFNSVIALRYRPDIDTYMRRLGHLSLPDELPMESVGFHRIPNRDWWPAQVANGLITQDQHDAAMILYIAGCEQADAIAEPVLKVITDVHEILLSVRTTKGLREAWPEVDQYLDLPDPSAGQLMRVDVGELNDNLADLWPQDAEAA